MTRALDIVYLSCCEKWWDWEHNGFFSRPAKLAAALAAHPGVRRMLVVNAPSSTARLLKPGSEGPPRSGLAFVSSKVAVLDQVRFLPKERVSAPAYRLNGVLHESSLAQSIAASAAVLGMERPVLWLSGPLVARTALAFPDATVVYDAMDEWLALPEMARMRREIMRSYRLILQRADVVFGVSERLVRRFSGGRPKASLVPNAVDAQRYREPGPEPEDLRAIPHPRVGYVGMLQDRIDVELVADVARRLPHANFIFVGPLLDAGHFEPLRGLPNVHLTGARPTQVVPDYLAAFDACILPHVDNELTRHMDPLKLYEYVAAGKPVVASDVAFVQPAELVRRASDARTFAVCLAQALDGTWVPDTEVRRSHLETSTWRSRTDRMLTAVEEARSRVITRVSAGEPGAAVVA